MKAALIALMFAATAFAQDQPANAPAGCGSEGINFDIKLDDSQHTLAEPEPGKARVYFIQDSGLPHAIGLPSTKLAIDGKWVGANKRNAWFSVSVEPGEHHVCATVQTFRPWQHVELAHFTWEAGRVYYYRTRLASLGEGAYYHIEFGPADSDEAKYLIGSFPMSTAHIRK